MYHVLYVDDEPVLLDLARRFLERTGEFRVETASSADEALSLPHLMSFDAVVSDYQMPEMDGIVFLKTLRSLDADLPFILFTGRGREEVVIQAINHGAHFYIQKGGDPKAQFAELMHKIKIAVDGQRVQDALRDSEQRLSDIISFLPDATFAIDNTGRVIAWNRAIEEMTGIPVRDMLGRGDYEYSLPFYGTRRPLLIDRLSDSDETLSRDYMNITRKGGTLSGTSDLPAPRGNHIHALIMAGPLYNRQGEKTGAIESIRDISKLRKKEMELLESEKRFRAVIESSPLPMVLSRKNHIIYSNIAFQHLVRVENSGELEGKPILDFIDPAYRDRVTRYTTDLMERKKHRVSYEVTGMRSDGAVIPVEITSAIIDLPDGPAALAFISDISERKSVQEMLEKKERFLEDIFTSIQDGILVLDRNLRIIRANRTMEAWYPGALPLAGKASSEVYGDGNAEGTGYPSLETLRSGRPAKGTIPWPVPGGSTGWLDIFSYPLIDSATGEMTGVIEYARNVTEEKRVHDELLAAYEQLSATEEELRQQYGDLARAETAVRESEHLYRLIVENSNESVYIYQDDRFLFVNRKASDFSGYSHAELMQMHIWDLIHPEDREVLRDAYRRRIAGEPLSTYFTARVLTRSGAIKTGDFFVDRIFMKDQPVLLGIVRESPVKARKEEQPDEGEPWFCNLVETSPDMIWEVDPQGRFRYISPQIRQIMGYNPAELVGKPVFTLIPEEYRSFVEEQIISGSRSLDSIFTVEVPARHRDGSRMVIEIRSTRSFDKNGKFIGMRGIAHDITERKRALSLIREQEELFQKIVTNVPDIVVKTDIEGNILYVNRQGLEFGGYERVEDLAGMPIIRFIAPVDYEKVMKYFKLMFEAPCGPVEYRVLKRDGTTVTMEANGDVLRTPDGSPAGLVFICRDITDRKKVEEALVATNRKLKLLSGVTRHDILNNVMIMLGFLDLAKQEKEYPALAPLLTRIEEKVREVWSQIDFTRVYEDLGTHRPQWQDVGHIVSSLRMPDGISCTWSGGTAEIFADPMLVKVFEILLDNSIRHGTSVSKISISVEKQPSGMVITYQDDGSGISADLKETVFEMGVGKNTGLGLFFAREVLALTGIIIRENGTPGSGARFEMVVPDGCYRYAP